MHEAFRVCLVCLGLDVLAGSMDGPGLAVMHLVWRHQSDADVMVILMVLSQSLLTDPRRLSCR
jgi:hypothetical protein